MSTVNPSSPRTEGSGSPTPQTGVSFNDQLYDRFRAMGRLSTPHFSQSSLLNFKVDYMTKFLHGYIPSFGNKNVDTIRAELASWTKSNQIHSKIRASWSFSLDPKLPPLTIKDPRQYELLWHLRPDLVIFARDGKQRAAIKAHAYVLALYCSSFIPMVEVMSLTEESKPQGFIMQPQALDLWPCTSDAVHVILQWMFDRSLFRLLLGIIRIFVMDDIAETLVPEIVKETEENVRENRAKDGTLQSYWVPQHFIKLKITSLLSPLSLAVIHKMAIAQKHMGDIRHVISLLNIKDYKLEGWLTVCEGALANMLTNGTYHLLKTCQKGSRLASSKACDQCMEKRDMNVEARQPEGDGTEPGNGMEEPGNETEGLEKETEGSGKEIEGLGSEAESKGEGDESGTISASAQ